ncbi:MAG TPA: hypothetical protein GXX59_02415 [Syntrophomonadaceae bacterium]|nr:hypothetical protein [Syntrophomonadaceae bacterium]
MTKKQLIISAVIAAVLIGLIIAVSVYGKSKNSNINDSKKVTYPEQRKIATSIGNGADGSKSPGTGTSSDSNSSGSSSNSGGSSKSAGFADSNNWYQKTYEAASPESSGYPIPKNNHFLGIEGSLKPSDPHKAELAIYLDFENSFDTQLQELRSTIQPILGSEITDEIVSYMKTKTSRNVGLDKWWETDSKKINVASGYADYIVELLSWKK